MWYCCTYYKRTSSMPKRLCGFLWNTLESKGSKSAMKVDPSSATECNGHINRSSRGSGNHIYPITWSMVTLGVQRSLRWQYVCPWDARTDLSLWYSLKALRNLDVREAHYADLLCNPLQVWDCNMCVKTVALRKEKGVLWWPYMYLSNSGVLLSEPVLSIPADIIMAS